MSKDPNAPFTRLPNLSIIPSEINNNGLYVPNCTANQIAAIPRDDLAPGGLIFDTTAEELLTYTAAGFWLPVLTAQSEIDFTDINCVNLTASAGVVCNTLSAADYIITTTLNVASAVSAASVESNVTIVHDLATIEDLLLRNTVAGFSAANDVSSITVTLDTGAGSGATATVKGSLLGGTFTLTTGSSPVLNGIIGTFAIPVSLTPYFTGSYGVVFTPASIVTAPINIYITTSPGTNLFIMGLSGTLAASTQYNWNFVITGSQKQ